MNITLLIAYKVIYHEVCERSGTKFGSKAAITKDKTILNNSTDKENGCLGFLFPQFFKKPPIFIGLFQISRLLAQASQ